MFPQLFTDQMNTTIRLEAPPQRIVSLVPSQTELLVDLGLRNQLMGITKFCIHPKGLLTPELNIGGTKQLKLEKIAALHPDLIIGNKEENTQSEIEWLRERFPVWMSDIYSMDDTLEMIQQIGLITNKVDAANNIKLEIELQFKNLNRDINIREPKKNVVYLIWNNPIMSAGSNTFIDAILQRIGLTNCVMESRYPILSEIELVEINPEILLLSTEPFPFGVKHIEHFQNILPNTTIKIVDGEFFSWYGSRLLYAPSYFTTLLKDLNTSRF